MNLKNLIAKGKLEALCKDDDRGTWLVGYRRKASSRKKGEWWLKAPRLIKPNTSADPITHLLP